MSELADPISCYEGYRRADPRNVQQLLALGDLYHRAGPAVEALSTLREGLALDPQFASLRSREATVLITLHRFDEAEASLRPLVQADPGNASLQHNLGLALYHQHQFEAARDAFAAARASGGTAVEPEAWAHLTWPKAATRLATWRRRAAPRHAGPSWHLRITPRATSPWWSLTAWTLRAPTGVRARR